MLEVDPHSERVLHLVRQWVVKAENDLLNASHTLKLGDTGPLDTVCFHAQQCVEKYLKALLSFYESTSTEPTTSAHCWPCCRPICARR